jgi:hypothetical protein
MQLGVLLDPDLLGRPGDFQERPGDAAHQEVSRECRNGDSARQHQSRGPQARCELLVHIMECRLHGDTPHMLSTQQDRHLHKELAAFEHSPAPVPLLVGNFGTHRDERFAVRIPESQPIERSQLL